MRFLDKFFVKKDIVIFYRSFVTLYREELAANPDIKSNLNWLPKSTNVGLEEINKYSNKYSFYKYNFSSLK